MATVPKLGAGGGAGVSKGKFCVALAVRLRHRVEWARPAEMAT